MNTVYSYIIHLGIGTFNTDFVHLSGVVLLLLEFVLWKYWIFAPWYLHLTFWNLDFRDLWDVQFEVLNLDFEHHKFGTV